MILKKLRILSQNFQKNKFLTDLLLEINKDFDIIFIQELSYLIICSISNSLSKNGNSIIEASNHPNWITFSWNLSNNNDYPWVISYINIWLLSLCFSLYKDILNHRNISCFSFFNNNKVFFLINVYSDSNQSTLKYFKDTEMDIHNILIMTSNFNIRGSN